MSRGEEVALLIGGTIVCAFAVKGIRREVLKSLRVAINGWRENPARMISQIITSFLIGQGIGWIFGYDQLSILLGHRVEFGQGHRLAEYIYQFLPHTFTVIWIIKVVEISSDIVRGFVEGRVYRRHGILPDGVATLFTQPLWVAYEVAEKILGALLRPDRVLEPHHILASIACIYGNLFRLGQNFVIWKWGGGINHHIAGRIERFERALVRGIVGKPGSK